MAAVNIDSDDKLSIDEALADPIVRLMMEADGLNVADVRAQMMAVARRLRRRNKLVHLASDPDHLPVDHVNQSKRPPNNGHGHVEQKTREISDA